MLWLLNASILQTQVFVCESKMPKILSHALLLYTIFCVAGVTNVHLFYPLHEYTFWSYANNECIDTATACLISIQSEDNEIFKQRLKWVSRV